MNIKIIAFLALVSLIPFVSAGKPDIAWVARSSGYIGVNDSLAFENYHIKAKISGSDKACITLYKNQNKIEQRDFNIGESRDYDNIRITLLGIKGEYSWIAVSVPDKIVFWKPSGTKLLRWGEKYEVENYTLRAETFFPDSVNLTISNKNMAESRVFSNNSFNDYGNLRIVVRNINQTGSVELEFLKYFMPNISAGIFTDKDEYAPDESVLVTLNLTSDAPWNIAGVNFESSMKADIRPAMVSLTNITGTRSILTKVDQLPVNSTIIISAEIATQDYNNNVYATKVSKVIRTLPQVSITKIVPKDTDEQNVTVELFIRNSGITEESVSVYDSVYDNERLNFKQLNWSIELKSGSSTNISYVVSARKLGRYIFPPAVAKWKNQVSSSKEITMTVHGPLIVLTKSAAGTDAFTDVNLVINNGGDRPALVDVSDTVPDGYSIGEGGTTWSGLLEAGERAAIKYTLKDNVETLPAASATYRDIRGVIRQAQSNIVVIEKTGSSPEPTESESPINSEPAEIISFMVSAFTVIAGIFSIVAMLAYLFIKLRTR